MDGWMWGKQEMSNALYSLKYNKNRIVSLDA